MAKIKKLLEDADPEITVVEFFPPDKSDDEEPESEGKPEPPRN